ncbi:hypothetical protein C0J52_00886 [Blattella germanica]|nr:hypothetical protein C0J52_00886 [Blattella germanica]
MKSLQVSKVSFLLELVHIQFMLISNGDNVVEHNNDVKMMRQYLNVPDLPNTFFYSSPCNGKTSYILAAVKQLFGNLYKDSNQHQCYFHYMTIAIFLLWNTLPLAPYNLDATHDSSTSDVMSPRLAAMGVATLSGFILKKRDIIMTVAWKRKLITNYYNNNCSKQLSYFGECTVLVSSEWNT